MKIKIKNKIEKYRHGGWKLGFILLFPRNGGGVNVMYCTVRGKFTFIFYLFFQKREFRIKKEKRKPPLARSLLI